MKNFTHYILFLLLILGQQHVQSQCINLAVSAGSGANYSSTQLYSENFSGQNNKGALHTGTDLTGVDWTVDVSSATLSNTNDFFKIENEVLKARDVDGNCFWISPSISIAEYENVSISLNAFENVWWGGTFESDDILHSEYSIDGGPWTYFATNGQLNDDFGSATVSQTGLDGTSLRIRITMNVNENDEIFEVDNITVTGSRYADVLCLGNSTTLGGSPSATWSGAANPSITYSWTPTTGLSDPSIANPTANPTSSTVYTLSCTYNDGGTICRNSSYYSLTVSPQVIASNNGPICVYDTVTLSESGGDASNWLWTSNGSATIIDNSNQNTQAVGVTDGEVFTVQGFDGFGCSSSQTTTVTVNPQPAGVTSSNYGRHCSDDNAITLTGGLPAGGVYANAAGDTGVVNGTFNPASVGYGSDTITKDVLYVYTDANGCSDTSISQITVIQAPNAELQFPFGEMTITNSGIWSKCNFYDTVFTMNIRITAASVANNSPNVVYDLDFGDGTNSISGMTPGTYYTNDYFDNKYYLLVLTATDTVTNCVRTIEQQFFWGTNPAVSMGNPGNTQNQCAPKRYGFVTSFVDNGGNPNTAGTEYVVQTNDGKPDSTFYHPDPASSLTSDTIFHTFEQSSCGYSTTTFDNAFEIIISARNGCGPSDVSVGPITQSDPPEAEIYQDDTLFCIDEPVTFVDSSSGGYFVSGSGPFACDTTNAVAWEVVPATGWTLVSGTLGSIPVDYFDVTTHGSSSITLTFQQKGQYSVNFYKVAPCGTTIIRDSTAHEFYIDSMPEALFVKDTIIGCVPLEVSNLNTSPSLNDFNVTFSWGSSTLIPGCDGNGSPTILYTPSDSTQIDLYLETFDLQTGKGVSGVNTDTSNVSWTIDVTGNAMVNANDFFAVSNVFGDPRLVARDVNDGNAANMIWYSPSVDISGLSSINLFLKARDSAAGTLEVDDTFESFYRIDGGAWTYFENNGQLSDDFGSVEVTQDSLSGSTLEIKVEMNVDDANEYLALDSVLVRAYTITDTNHSQYLFTRPGMYQMSLTATNICGNHTYNDTVTVQGPPDVTINSINDFCDSVDLSLSATYDTCFASLNSYIWALIGSDTDTAYVQNPTGITYDSVASYTVLHVAGNQCGSGIDSANFDVFESPNLTMTGPDSVCIGDNVQLNPSVADGLAPYSYAWSNNQNVSDSTVINPTTNSSVDAYLILTVTDANTCTDTDSTFLEVLDLPVVDAGVNQNVCPEDTAFLNGSYSGGIAPHDYYWDLGVLSDTTILNPYYDMGGTATFVLTVVDNFGCENTDNVIINEYLSPTVDAGNDTTICDQPISVNFSGSPAGGAWTGTNITAAGVFTPTAIAVDQVIYQYTDANGCANEDTLDVNVVATTMSNAGADLEECVSEPNVVLQGTPYGGTWDHASVTSNTTMTLYEEYFTGLNGKGGLHTGIDVSGCNWNVDISGASLSSAPQYLKVVSNRMEGRDLDGPAYWLTPTINISNFVNISISLDASEWGSLEVSDVLESEYRIDGGAWTTFTNNGSLAGNFSSATVSQSGLSGNTLEVRVKFENNSSNEYLRIDNVVVTGDVSGLFTISTADTLDLVYIYGSGNCQNNDTMQLVINSLPTVTAGTDSTICISDSINLSGLPAGGNWSGDGITDVSGIFVGDSAGVGSHTIYYTFVDTNSCENLDSLVVTVLALPVVNAGNDTILCNQPGVVTFAGNLLPGYWTGTNIDSSGGFEPTGTGIYDNYYHHTDANGCYNTDTLQINVIDPTNADAGADIQRCVDVGLLQFSGIPIGGVWSDNGIAANGDFTPTVQDTLDFVYSYGTGNCLTRDTVNLIVNPLPTVNALADFSVCIDDTIQVLTANVVGGVWSGVGITDPNGDFTPDSAGVGIHKITYTYTDSNTCVNADSVFITVNGLPIVTTPVDTTICDLPSPVTFTGSPAGGNWLGANISMGGVYTPNGDGVFDVYYEFFDANTCYNVDTLTLTVNAPQIADAGTDIEVCEDTGLVQITGLPLGAGTWSGSGVQPNGDFNVVVVDTVDLVYNIGAGNCFTTDTMNFLIHPLPTLSIDTSFELCISFGDSTLNFNPSGGVWSGTGMVNDSTGLFNTDSAGVGTHQLIYSYQHPITGCWNYDSLEITVNPLPIVDYSHDSIFCYNVGTPITNLTTGASIHTWTVSSGHTSSDSAAVFSIDTVGVFDINYIAETNRGCLDSMRTVVEVIEPPVAAYTAPDSGCGPLIVNFTNSSVGTYVNYLWDLGLTNTGGLDSTTTDTVPSVHSYPASLLSDTTYFTSLVVQNFCGVDTATLDIIAMPQPVSRFGPSSGVGCSSGTITFANNSYGLPDTYWWDYGDGNNGSSSDTLSTHYYPPTGANQFFVVTMAVTNECGTDTSQQNITIQPSSLLAFFTVDTTAGCEPFTVDFQQFTVGGTNYSWDFGDGNFSNLYSPTHTYLDTGTYEVMLAVSNACNYDTAYRTIRVNTSPNVEFTVVDDTLCAGSMFTFNNQSDLGISNTWDFGDGNTSYLTNPTHIYDSAGTFMVVLTGTELTNYCPTQDSIQLVVLPYPDITATSDINSGCIPSVVNFTSNYNSMGFVTWDFGDGNTSTLDNPTHTYNTDGYFNVFVRFEDLSGCVDSFDFNFTAYPVPQLTFTPNQLDTCELPMDFQFANSTTNGDNYLWDFGDGNTSTLISPTHTYIASGTYNVQLNVNNTYGCEDSLTYPITINPIPNANFNVTQLDTCVLPNNYNFSNMSNGGLAYTWHLGDGSISNMQNLTYGYTNPGTYTVWLYSMNNFMCSDSMSTTITVLDVPDASFNYTKYDSCILPSNYGFTNTSTSANSYLWDFGGLASSIMNNPTMSFQNAGFFDVSLIAYNVNGCTDTTTSTVNVLPIINADFTLVDNIGCEPFEAVFLNSSQYASYYSWDFGDGNTGSFVNGFHTFNNVGTYNVKLVAEDLMGCLDSITTTVTVNPSPDASFTYTTSDSCYVPLYLDYINTSQGANSFQWDFGNGQTSTFNNPQTSFDTLGVYLVELVATNNFNCTDTLRQFFSVGPKVIPSVSISYDDTICLRDTSYLSSFVTSADSLVWNLGNGSFSNADSVALVYDTPGQYQISLYAYNTASGCGDTADGSSSLVVLPSPIADFTYNREYSSTIPRAGTVEFTNNSVGATVYWWDFGFNDGTNNPNPTYNYSYMDDGSYMYTLYAYNDEGCVDSASMNLVVNFRKGLYVPNAIYVGHPDYEVSHFVPKGSGMETYHIEIFDTFGNVIWESEELDDEGKPTGGWDGTFRGITVEQDVYVWKVEATFKDETPWEGKYYWDEDVMRKTGTVTVIR